MPIFPLKTAGRQFRRQFGAAIRQNLIRALTELITNSDDSYHRMADRKQPGCGRIDILYERTRRMFGVVDQAEGMDAGDMQRMISSYGAATSGLYEDKAVRGYFGKGLKDVLFSMENGSIQSIKNDQVYTARFLWEEDQPLIEIAPQSEPASQEVRQSLGIFQGNGTRVNFRVPAQANLPRHESLLRNLSNFYMLRLINVDDDRCIYLRTRNAGGSSSESRIEYCFPSGEYVLEDDFEIAYGNGFPVHLLLKRASSALTQSGEDREGGLLIHDQHASVLDLTLFQYDHDDFATHLYGDLEIQNFRDLLKADEHILTDTRDGLDRHHPFVKLLASAVEERLHPVVERERHFQMQNTSRSLTQRQQGRLDQSINQINALLSNLAGLRVETGTSQQNDLEVPPEGGMAFRPTQAQIALPGRTQVNLRIDTSIIRAGTVVHVISNNPRIKVQPQRFEVSIIPGKLVINYPITLSARKPGERAEITARTGQFQTEMAARAVRRALPTPEDGFAFVPDVLRVANNVTRYATLHLDGNRANPGDSIQFSSDNEEIRTRNKEIILSEEDFFDGVAQVKLPIRGAGIGQRGQIAARWKEQVSRLNVEVVSKAEKIERGPLLFTGYRFDAATPSRVRASYDEETGLVWIYLRNPVVERYFSSLPLQVALNTPHCQILLAEIVLEQVSWIARRKMLESGAAMYLSNNQTAEDLAAVRKFMNEFGEKIHSWIADDKVIQQVVENAADESEN